MSVLTGLSKMKKFMRKYLSFLPTSVAILSILGILAASALLFADQLKVKQEIGPDQSAGQTMRSVSDLKIKSTPELLEVLGMGDPSFRTQVKIEIGKRFRISVPPEREEIIRSLKMILKTDPKRERRVDAASRLDGFVNFELMPHEREQIAEVFHETIRTDQDPAVVIFAVRALPDFDKGDKAIEALISVLDNKELTKAEPKLHTETFLSLGKVGESAIPFLVESLADFPEPVMIALSFTKSREALQILDESSRSDDAQIRYYAIHALGLWGSTQSISLEERRMIKEALSRALHDADKDVREKAKELNVADR